MHSCSKGFTIYFWLWGLLLLGASSLNAQQPAHFILGEAELSNVNIYDLTQDPEGNYWLATDQGIIKYDGYHYMNVVNPSMLGTSVFGWTFDNNKKLYCHNLSGQIFKIENQKCQIYFKIPDSLMSNEIYFEFDEANNLVIASKSLFKVLSNGSIEILHQGNAKINSYSTLFKKSDKSLITCIYSQKKILTLKNGEVVIQDIKYEGNQGIPLHFMYLDDSLYFYDKLSANLLVNTHTESFALKKFIPQKASGLHRLYSNNEFLFVALSAGGMLAFDKRLTSLFNGNVLFENEIISDFFQDEEGNLLFGTFKGGIIAVPQMDIIDLNYLPTNVKYTHITSSEHDLFLGTQDGRIFHLSEGSLDKYEVFRQSAVKPIEALKYFHQTNELLVDEAPSVLINLKNLNEKRIQIGAVKDVEFINDSSVLISTNSGVFFYNPFNISLLSDFNIEVFQKKGSMYQLLDLVGRTNAVNFDIKNKIIFAATPQGLKMATKDSIGYYEINNLPVICLDIQYSGEYVYVATQSNGILVFKNGKFVKQWSIETGLLSNTITQIKTDNKNIYVSTNKGIQILDYSGSVLYTLNPSEGLHNFGVIDFEIFNNTLWLVQQKGFQKVELDKLESASKLPQIKLNWVIQNTDTIDITKIHSFNHQQSKFEFQVASNTLRYQNELEYHFQLKGLDEQWQVNPYKNNVISFLSLPSGTYTFSVKAVLRDQESETISYTFTIAPPYWNTWWFYTLSVLLVLAVSGGIFASFYIRQRKKIQFQNELNNSKLSAIQSQMNPHFIFNALNSIQDFIVQNEKKLAGKYLGKFADLMRIYLNHSQIKTVSLKEEIEALKLYLELEKLRFNTLDFIIEVDAAIDENLMTIPTLLIQPYVENSLKHGLLHKREEKTLSVRFKLIPEHDLIECTIIDNGIGRLASAEVNKMRNPHHQSFATKATKNRLELLNYGHKKPIGEQIIDLYDENGLAKGTKVILRIPILD